MSSLPLPPLVGITIGLPVLLVAIAIASIRFKWSERYLSGISTVGSGISLIASIGVCGAISSTSPYTFNIWVIPFSVDALSAYFMLVVNAVVFAASFHIPRYLWLTNKGTTPVDKSERPANKSSQFSYMLQVIEWTAQPPRFFYLFFNLFHMTMVFVMVMDNFFLMWIFIQLTTITSAPLIGFQRQPPADIQSDVTNAESEFNKNRRRSEAAWKYLMISSAGILIALLGILFLLAAFHTPRNGGSLPDTIQWSTLTQTLTTNGNLCSQMTQDQLLQSNTTCPLKGAGPLVELSFLLIVLGFGAKAGLFPMHTWLPDGHGEAPSPVSALLSGVLIKSAFYAILRFFVITNLTLHAEDPTNQAFTTFAPLVLLIVGLGSLVASVPFILHSAGKVHFKRVLAQHSLQHMGIIALGFGFGSAIAFFGALLHVMNHAFTKALMFLSYGSVELDYAEQGIDANPKNGVVTPTGVFRSRPIYGVLLALGGLALVGAPPFSVFLSEFTILSGGIQGVSNTHNTLSLAHIIGIVIFVGASLLIFGGMVVHLGRLLLGPKPKHMKSNPKSFNASMRTISLVALLLLLLIFGFTAFPVAQVLKSSVTILCQGGVCR